jgi:hypothetical protein
MSAVALQPIQELRASLTLTPDLAVWVCAVEDGAEPPEGLPPAVVAEAQRLAEQAERLLAPPTEQQLRGWLVDIAAHYYALRPTHDPKAPAAYAATVIDALRMTPIGTLTRANRHEVWANNDWLPSIGQIERVLFPDRDKLETRARALRAVAGAARTGLGC